MDSPPQTEKKRSKSDIISHATVGEYVMAHAKPNGGFRSFLHSNLFAALAIWLLGQAVICGGFIVSSFIRTSQLSEWKGQVDATLKRMDEQGTVHGRYEDQTEDRDIVSLQGKVERIEQDTRHLEVLESEHRRLTKDVEDLKNGRK